MSEAMVHRGAGEEAFAHHEGVGLAHRCIAAADAGFGTAAHPLTSADGRYTLVYNGRIYNHPELRRQLEAEGCAFESAGEAEVLLQALVHWGEEALERFEGMFAFALWDEEARSLVLARDPLGIKPLFYHYDEARGCFYFATEIKALLEAMEKVEPNDRVIYRYLNFRIHDDGRETFFAGVSRLGAGEILTLRLREGALGSSDSMGSAPGVVWEEPRVYSSLRSRLEALADEEGEAYSDDVIKEFRAILEASIKRCMDADELVGTSLSGGLDSSVVAGVVADQLRAGRAGSDEAQKEKLSRSLGSAAKTFSAVFPNEKNDEEPYVDAVLELYGDLMDPLKIVPKPETFLEDLEDFVRSQEEPVISTGPYAQYVLMREASEHVAVLLDGQGADEMLAGYNPYFLVYLRQLRGQGKWGSYFREAWFCRDILWKLLTTKFSSLFSRPKQVRDLMAKDFAAVYQDEDYGAPQNHLKKRLLEDIFNNSLPALLRYEDRNTARFGLEGRVPFVTEDLLLRIFRTEDEAIIHKGWNKRVLRESMEDYLPKKISRRRKKIGFTTPEVAWFEELRGPIYEIFASQSFAGRKYFNQGKVLEAFRDYMTGSGKYLSFDFWRILNVELWLRCYIDEPVVEDVEEPAPWIPGQVNEGKHLTIESGGLYWDRYPVRTPMVSEDTKLSQMIEELLPDYLAVPEIRESLEKNQWGLALSEKVVAISQGRSYKIYDMKPGFWAKFLSRYVHRTPAGIGLGSPYTMELAIQEVGLPRILLASAGAAVGRIFGKRGIFYNIAGGDVRAIDGPTEYSVYPSNVSAKLPPKDPDKVAAQLSAALRESGLLSPEALRNFTGFLVIDANDLGCNLLGSDTPLEASVYEGLFGDNPKGQGGQQTPLLIFVERPASEVKGSQA